MANGQEYEVDCIIYASGFEITSSYQRRIGIPIYGIDGESIYDHWQDGMRSMHGLMTHGFPNLFLCGGLFVFQLGANYCYGVDVQAEQVAYTVSELMQRQVQAANVSAAAEQGWIFGFVVIRLVRIISLAFIAVGCWNVAVFIVV